MSEHATTPPAAPAPSGGFKYFVPGLIVGFIIGAVVGVLLPEFADRGGPRLQPPTGTGEPRLHDEEAKMNEGQLSPETAPETTPETTPESTPDSSGTTAPDSTPPAPSGH
jgi:hypothetical protein